MTTNRRSVDADEHVFLLRCAFDFGRRLHLCTQYRDGLVTLCGQRTSARPSRQATDGLASEVCTPCRVAYTAPSNS